MIYVKQNQTYPNKTIFSLHNLKVHNYICHYYFINVFCHLHAYVAIIAPSILGSIFRTKYSILLFYIQVQHPIGVEFCAWVLYYSNSTYFNTSIGLALTIQNAAKTDGLHSRLVFSPFDLIYVYVDLNLQYDDSQK